MELKQIKELMTSMKREGIGKLSIKETSGFELTLERECEGAGAAAQPVVYHPPMAFAHRPGEHAAPHFTSHAHPHAPLSVRPGEESGHKKEEALPGKYVASPMVGTFYVAVSPEDSPFVKVGDRVDENTVVCIIEAMKVMNEVKAGVSGTVAEICVQNAHPVEFGAKMFRIV